MRPSCEGEVKTKVGSIHAALGLAAVVAGTAGYVASFRPAAIVGAVGLAAIPAAVFAFRRWLVTGLLLMLVVLLPFTVFPQGAKSWQMMVVVLFLAVVAAPGLVSPNPVWRQLRAPLLLLLLASVVAASAGPDPVAAFRSVLRHGIFAWCAYVTAAMVRDEDRARWVTLAIVTSVWLLVGIGLLQELFGTKVIPFYAELNPNTTFLGRVRVPGPFVTSLEFAQFLLLWTLVALGVGLTSNRRGLRVLSWATFVAGSMLVVLTFSRGAFAALLLAMMFALAVTGTAGRFALAGIVLTLVAAGRLVIEALPAEFVYRMGQAFANLESGRFLLWQLSLPIATHHPLGIGLGNFALVAPQFVPESIIRFNQPGTILEGAVSAHAESMYLTILYELGVIGLAALCWAITTCFRMGMSAYRESTATGVARGLGLGVAAAWVGLCVFAMVTHNFIDVRNSLQVWLLVGLSVACCRVAGEGNQLTRSSRRMPSEPPAGPKC